jgi:hypothetical protein
VRVRQAITPPVTSIAPWIATRSACLQMLKRSHIESARGAAFFYIATKGIVRGTSAWRALSALEMPPIPLEIRSHAALAPWVLALPEGMRARAGVSVVLEHADGPSGEVVAIRAAADPRYVAVVLAVFPEAGFCGVALARRQPRHLRQAGVALGYARPVCFLLVKPILVSIRVAPCMVEGSAIGTLSSQGERPMSIPSGTRDVHGGLMVTATATLAVAAVATPAGSMFPRERSAGSTRRGPGGYRKDLC